MINLHEEPLWPYLFEIAARPEATGSILTGGLGLRVKRAWLTQQGIPTLFKEPPTLRATTDLDIFLRLDLWTKIQGAQDMLGALHQLGYKTILHGWHLQKPFAGFDEKVVKLDLQARPPVDGEAVNVRKRQVGKAMGTGIAGFLTPEAFAVDDSPIQVIIEHGGNPAVIYVPHPYTWLNLKVAAAYDWFREVSGEIEPKKTTETGDSARLKHVYDVYAIVGMMTDDELTHAETTLAVEYADHEKAAAIREAARRLYGSPESEGCQAIRTYDNGAWADHFDAHYEDFWDALSRALGIR